MTLRSEIDEQPALIARLVTERAGEARAIGRALARTRHITIAARGSSDNAATYGKYLFESAAGIVTALSAPSVVTRYRSAPRFAGGAVIGISQSGASPDVTAVVAAGRRQRAYTLAITDRLTSRLARAAARTFHLGAGGERSVAATKSFTLTCAAIALIAQGAAPPRARAALALDGLPGAVSEAIAADADAAALARTIARDERLVVLGRGYAYAATLEVALKVKELARVWAEPYSAADLLHGPIALVERGVPVLVVAARGGRGSPVALLRALRERGARILAITDDPALAARADAAVLLRSRVPETIVPIALVVAGQLVAAALARERGLDPDRPSGLTKVTRTR